MKTDVYRLKIGEWPHWMFFLAFLLLVLSNCSGQSGKGNLEIRIKDHEEAIASFSKVDVSIETIRLSPTVGFRLWRLGWVTIHPEVTQLDLTKFVNNAGMAIFKGEVGAGAFEGFDLKIRAVRGILRKDSRQIPIDNKVVPVALSFPINPGTLTTVVIDLSVMDMSDHPPATYELQLAGYEVYENGKLMNKVPPG